MLSENSSHSSRESERKNEVKFANVLELLGYRLSRLSRLRLLDFLGRGRNALRRLNQVQLGAEPAIFVQQLLDPSVCLLDLLYLFCDRFLLSLHSRCNSAKRP